jgi:hypothetical protein
VLGVYTGSALGALTPVVTTPESGDWLNGEGPNRSRAGTKRVAFNATAGTTYHITVQGAGFSMASSGPITLSLVGPPAVPFAPTGFTAVRTGPSTIELDWTDAAVDEEYYELQRSTDGADWSPLAQLAPDATFHTDATAVGATTDYHYRIRAVNTVGQSAWVSASVTVPQPPPAPGGLSVTALSAHDLSVTWTPAPNSASHRLERSTDAGSTWTWLATLGASASSYTDVGLAPSTTYHYRVRAANELGAGPWSATASGATQALGALSLSYPQSTYTETAGSFTATVTRGGTGGAQTVFLTSNSARLVVPSSVAIPDGQSGATFTVTVVNDAIINPADTATITAFAPAALIGESFDGALGGISGQSSGWGWGGAWFHDTNGGMPNVVASSLSYTKNGTLSRPGSNMLRLNSTGDARRQFPAKITSGEFWASALIDRNSTNWGTQIILRDNPGSGNWARVRYTNSTDHWILEAGTGNFVQLHNSNITPAVLYVVMRFDFANRKVHAWLNPEVSGSAPTNALGYGVVDMQTGLTGINRFDVGGNSTLDGFDELRVATSFANLHGGTTTTRGVRLIDDEAHTPAQAWLTTHFGTPIPAGSAAWTADPDGDGVPNLLEYALGTDPLTPAAQPPLEPSLTPSLPHSLTLTFFRARAELTYEVLASSDLVTWTVIATNPGTLGQPVTVTDSAPAAPRRFLRLRVLQ